MLTDGSFCLVYCVSEGPSLPKNELIVAVNWTWCLFRGRAGAGSSGAFFPRDQCGVQHQVRLCAEIRLEVWYDLSSS